MEVSLLRIRPYSDHQMARLEQHEFISLYRFRIYEMRMWISSELYLATLSERGKVETVLSTQVGLDLLSI